MPKINTRDIPGYADMTPEEKLSTLESIEIPADQTEEIINLKRGLSQAHAEIAANKEAKEDAGEIWKDSVQRYTPEIQAKVDSLSDTIAIGREALELESCGYDYATALKLSEAVHKGDFETAAKYMQMYENNERTMHAAEIKEAEETAKLRRAFGLR